MPPCTVLCIQLIWGKLKSPQMTTWPCLLLSFFNASLDCSECGDFQIVTVGYRIFECGLQNCYLSFICHYKGIHFSLIMMMMMEALLRRRRDFLHLSIKPRQCSWWRSTPFYRVIFHILCTSQFTQSLCTSVVEWLRRRRHILRFEITEWSKLPGL